MASQAFYEVAARAARLDANEQLQLIAKWAEQQAAHATGPRSEPGLKSRD